MAECFTDQFFESLHKAEFERKDKHEAADGFLLAGLSLLGTVGLYFLRIHPTRPEGIGWVFVSLGAVYGMLIASAAICVALSVWPRWIAYISDPGDIEKYAEGLRAHFGFEHHEEAKVNAAIDNEMRNFARKQHAKCAERNRRTNQLKLAWQTRAKIAISWAIIVLLLNAVPTYLVQRNHSEIQTVKIINRAGSPPAECMSSP